MKDKNGRSVYDPSHFVAVTLQDPVIRQNYEKLMAKVKKDPSYGIEDWMWLKPQDLHITITMVPLETPEKLKIAKEVLQSL